LSQKKKIEERDKIEKERKEESQRLPYTNKDSLLNFFTLFYFQLDFVYQSGPSIVAAALTSTEMVFLQ
jgi:hypothetical protein